MIQAATSKTVHVFNTQFYTKIQCTDVSPVKNWTKNVDLFGCDVVIIPVHIPGNPGHWTLCIVEPKSRDITYYDSMGGRNSLCLQNTLNYLRTEHEWKKRAGAFGMWNLHFAANIGKQPNWWDCGVFLCHYARMVVESQQITENIDWLPSMRRHMVREILAGCLQERGPTVSNIQLLLRGGYSENGLQSSSQVLPTTENALPLSHKWGNKFAGHGIQNPSKTVCFAAATLQALFHCAIFVSWLRSDCETRHRKTCSRKDICGKPCLSCIVAELYFTSLKSTVDLSPLIQSLSDFWPEYNIERQQDCHEFLIKLLDHLDRQFNYRSLGTKCPMKQIFNTTTQSVVTCNVCKLDSTTNGEVRDLSLSVHPALATCISEYFSPETIQQI